MMTLIVPLDLLLADLLSCVYSYRQDQLRYLVQQFYQLLVDHQHFPYSLTRYGADLASYQLLFRTHSPTYVGPSLARATDQDVSLELVVPFITCCFASDRVILLWNLICWRCCLSLEMSLFKVPLIKILNVSLFQILNSNLTVMNTSLIQMSSQF